jgi:subtilisin
MNLIHEAARGERFITLTIIPWSCRRKTELNLPNRSIIISFIILILLSLVSVACCELTISTSTGDASGSSGYSESLGAKINDQIHENTALAGSSLRQSFAGSGSKAETFSVTNNAGDHADVGFDIKKSKSYSGSYTLSPETVNYAMATEKLNVNKADLIHAFANAESRDGNSATADVQLTKGSLIGYTNSAYATLGEATTSQNFRSSVFAQVEGTQIKVDNQAFHGNGYISRAAFWNIGTSGSIAKYSGSAIATQLASSAIQDFTASGDHFLATGATFHTLVPAILSSYGSSGSYGDFINANNMHISIAVMRNGEKSEADYYSSGTAKVAEVSMSASYYEDDHVYDANTQGKWYDGNGEFSGNAKTVKAATSSMDMTTNSDQIETDTVTQKTTFLTDHSSMAEGGSRINNIITGNDVSRFQGHLYAFAYPENVNHLGQEEYGSTNSIGVKGKGITTASGRGWGTPDILTGSYQNFRAVDLRVLDPVSGTAISTTNNIWEVPARTQLPTQKVPLGIKTMYSNNKLKKTSGGQGVDVAVIDTGVDTLHPDIVMRMADYADASGVVEYGDSRADPVGHGTHVVGILAADGGFDGNGIWGMAPQVNLHVYNVNEYANGVLTGNLDDNAISNAIYRATDLGCDIISMSLGSQTTSATYSDAIKYASDNGVLIIAASGNGIPNDSPEINYPARDDNVIAVGAVDNAGKNAAWWSSPGDVDFAAPGVDVYSTYPTWDGSYALDTGTSMATPHISGLAARLWSSLRFTPNPLLSEADLVNVYMEGMAKDVTTVDTKLFYDASSFKGTWVDSNGVSHDGIDYYAGSNSPLSGAPLQYYQTLSAYLNKNTKKAMTISKGKDCLTGLGVPTLPKGTQ